MSAPRLYLDEDVDPALAEVLRQRGHDVIATGEVAMRGRLDSEQLDFAIRAGRALLTHNVRDFARLCKELAAASRSHAGVIFAQQIDLGELVRRTLNLLARETAESLVNQARWLSGP